jgi:hypothetical protein
MFETQILYYKKDGLKYCSKFILTLILVGPVTTLPATSSDQTYLQSIQAINNKAVSLLS